MQEELWPEWTSDPIEGISVQQGRLHTDGQIECDDWICTYTGGRVRPLDPDPETINIQDIAHALANVCRYTGHCKRFYSVAEHSVLCSRIAPPELKLAALLHDGAEAYLADVARPVKQHSSFNFYREADKRLEGIILRKFCGMDNLPREVKEIDNRMLITEALQLMGDVSDWNWPVPPYEGLHIDGWMPHVAKWEFMNQYRRLTEHA